jgi:hypothetical protein
LLLLVLRGLKNEEMDANESRFLTVLVGVVVFAGSGGGWKAEARSAAVWLVGKLATTCGIPTASADTLFSMSGVEDDSDEDSDPERG